jgi:hypothetical protein
MTTSDSVIQWLLDSDPSIRWQVKRDLLHAPTDEVAAERARVATEGWGAQLLALQGADGAWSGTAWNHGWDSTMHVLTLLRELGLDPNSDAARQAVDRVRKQVHWMGWDWDGSWKGQDFVGNPYFAGEVEPCINGQVGASGAYFGQDIERIIGRLLTEQLADGGWNCDAPNDSQKGSFNTTLCVLECLLEYELAGGPRRAEVTPIRLRGQEYLLERHLFHRKSTGEALTRDRRGESAWTSFTFPNWWHYDVLRALDYLRHAEVQPDEQVAEAIALVESKRGPDGRWRLEHEYEGKKLIEVNEGVGQPSRWITLKALRVLDWYKGRG